MHQIQGTPRQYIVNLIQMVHYLPSNDLIFLVLEMVVNIVKKRDEDDGAMVVESSKRAVERWTKGGLFPKKDMNFGKGSEQIRK